MNAEYLRIKNQLDQLLEELVPKSLGAEHPLCDAMSYGVKSPGKRIRGVMTVVFCNRLGVSSEEALPFAVALELIHAYSLVHDDMPEMDNDDYRRGLLTCHKKFGVDMALLAGDGILNFSIEFLLKHRKLYQTDRFIDALDVLYSAAGSNGMLLGQVLDKAGESHALSLDELLLLHRKKTGALLMAPIKIAECLSATKNKSYVNYCDHIGLAFQIKDDLLDVEGSAEILGKEIGKDRMENKSTFVTILGVQAAREYLNNELEAAMIAAENDPFLMWLAEYIGLREK